MAIRPDHKTAVVINGDGNTGFAAGPIEIIDLINGTVLQQIRAFGAAKVSLTGAVFVGTRAPRERTTNFHRRSQRSQRGIATTK